MTLIFFLNVRSTLIELSSTFAKTSAISSGFLRYTLGELPPPFAPNNSNTGFYTISKLIYFNFFIFKFKGDCKFLLYLMTLIIIIKNKTGFVFKLLLLQNKTFKIFSNNRRD